MICKKKIIFSSFLIVCIAAVFCMVNFHYDENSKNQYAPEDDEIKVIDAFFQTEDASVKYPVVCPESDEVNEKINSQINKVITEYCKYPSICSYEVDYEIKCFNQEYLSILFEGIQFPFGAAHPSDIAWGITFDMKSGKTIGITDIIEEKELQDKLSKKLFVTKRGMDIDRYEDLAGETDWCEKYTGYSMHYFDKEHKNDFYLSDESIGIMFGVSHAIGDYIIVEIERDINTKVY